MEDKKNLQLNTTENLPEVPRDENGKIIIDQIAIDKDDKNNYIIPDHLFDIYFRELPKGTKNSSGTWRACNNGKIKIFGGDPEDDKRIQDKGREANSSAWVKRRTCREILEDLARMPADSDTLERLGLAEGTNNLEAATFAQYRKAQQGDTKAMEYIRDTVGEKPTENINATVESITPEDKALLDRVAARLKNDNS